MINQGEGEDYRIEKEEKGYREVYHINIMNQGEEEDYRNIKRKGGISREEDYRGVSYIII